MKKHVKIGSVAACHSFSLSASLLQGGSNMTGTNCDLFTHKQSRSYLNHLYIHTRWFKYDRDKLWLVYTQLVPVIFEPPCTIHVSTLNSRAFCLHLYWLTFITIFFISLYFNSRDCDICTSFPSTVNYFGLFVTSIKTTEYKSVNLLQQKMLILRPSVGFCGAEMKPVQRCICLCLSEHKRFQ